MESLQQISRPRLVPIEKGTEALFMVVAADSQRTSTEAQKRLTRTSRNGESETWLSRTNIDEPEVRQPAGRRRGKTVYNAQELPEQLRKNYLVNQGIAKVHQDPAQPSRDTTPLPLSKDRSLSVGPAAREFQEPTASWLQPGWLARHLEEKKRRPRSQSKPLIPRRPSMPNQPVDSIAPIVPVEVWMAKAAAEPSCFPEMQVTNKVQILHPDESRQASLAKPSSSKADWNPGGALGDELERQRERFLRRRARTDLRRPSKADITLYGSMALRLEEVKAEILEERRLRREGEEEVRKKLKPAKSPKQMAEYLDQRPGPQSLRRPLPMPFGPVLRSRRCSQIRPIASQPVRSCGSFDPETEEGRHDGAELDFKLDEPDVTRHRAIAYGILDANMWRGYPVDQRPAGLVPEFMEPKAEDVDEEDFSAFRATISVNNDIYRNWVKARVEDLKDSMEAFFEEQESARICTPPETFG
jgi:hypothetical protein